MVRSVLLAISTLLTGVAASSGQPPSATAAPPDYRLEALPLTDSELRQRFTEAQIAILEKLNRRDREHLVRIDPPVPGLVVPAAWEEDELRYSPLPLVYESSESYPKVIVVDQGWQAFGAYERGRLVRWGPVSTGRKESPTPSGLFHLTWKARSRRSTDNQAWLLTWYFNFVNSRGVSFHQFDLPGYPASHACVRLLERDAQWLFDWGEQWILDSHGQSAFPGTPVRVLDTPRYGARPIWTEIDKLAATIELPEMPARDTSAFSAALDILVPRVDRIDGCATRRIEGEVTYGNSFESAIGGGLRLVLASLGGSPEQGWTLEIRGTPGGEDSDHVYPVSPPFRFFNPRYVGAIYSMSARDALQLSVRPFNFVTTRADRRVASREVRRILWPSVHPAGAEERAVVSLSLLRLGRGVLTIVDGRVGTRAVGSESRETVEWIKFRVDLCWP